MMESAMPNPPRPEGPDDTIEEYENPNSSVWSRLKFSKAVLALLAIAVLGAGLLAAWLLISVNGGGREPDVEIWIDTANEATSGSAAEFRVIIENRDSSAITGPVLNIVYPDGFRFLDSDPESNDGFGRNFQLTDLAAGATASITVSGIFSGSPGEAKTVQARLYYQLDSSTAQFSRGSEASVSLRAPDFNFRISAANQIVQGQKIEYRLNYQNISQQDFSRAQVRVQYPPGFEFLQSAPSPVAGSNEVWEIGALPRLAEGEIVIIGLLDGPVGEDRTLRADLGYIESQSGFILQSRAFSTARLLSSPLDLTHTLANPADAVNEGEQLQYIVRYRNTGVSGLKNIRIRVEFVGSGIDLASVTAEGGALVDDGIVWNSSGLRALEILQPDSGGELRFSAAVSKALSQRGVTNPEILTILTAQTDEYPDDLRGDSLSLKVRGKISGKVTAEHVSGPNPPVAGQDTVYRINLASTTTVNEISGVVWQAFLSAPTVTLVEGTISPEESRHVNFVSSSGRITWRIGDQPPFSPRTLTFNVTVRPSLATNVQSLILVSSSQLSGTDQFVGQPVISEEIPDLRISNIK